MWKNKKKPSYITANLSKNNWKKMTSFSYDDFGWIVMSIGVATGASIAFLPIQIGLSGFWSFVLASLISFPILYIFQNMIINILAKSDDNDDYITLVGKYLGKNLGLFVGLLYFILLVIGLFLYTTTLTNDVSSFIDTLKIFTVNTNINIFGLILITSLIFLSLQTEKFLFKISTYLVFLKVITLVVLSFMVIPYWNFNNLIYSISILEFIKETIILLPFSLISFIFFTSLSPMVVFYKDNIKNKEVVRYKSLRVMKISYFVMLIVMSFYILSFNLSLTHEDILYCYYNNISTLAVAVKNSNSLFIKIFSILLNIFAVISAFFSLFLSFKDSLKGILLNLMLRFNEKYCKSNIYNTITTLVSILVCWSAVFLNIHLLIFTKLLSPIFGVTACIVPSYILLKNPNIIYYNNIILYITIIYGIILIFSPLFNFL